MSQLSWTLLQPDLYTPQPKCFQKPQDTAGQACHGEWTPQALLAEAGVIFLPNQDASQEDARYRNC